MVFVERGREECSRSMRSLIVVGEFGTRDGFFLSYSGKDGKSERESSRKESSRSGMGGGEK